VLSSLACPSNNYIARILPVLLKRGCEEWELFYLDGDNAALFYAAKVCQGNLSEWHELLDTVENY